MKRSDFPKQLWHWLRQHGFKVRKRTSNWYYFTGKGRRWRFCVIDNELHFQSSVTAQDFDRWANSLNRSVPFKCKTHDEFCELLKILL